MDSIVANENRTNLCEPKISTFENELRPNILLSPPQPEYTFRGRNQQEGVQAIVDAALHRTMRTIDLRQPPLEVAVATNVSAAPSSSSI